MTRVYHQMLIALLLCASPVAQASLFTFLVDGTVQRAGRPGYVENGEPIQLYFTYESQQADANPDPQVGRYAFQAGAVSIGRFNYLITPFPGYTDPVLGELGGINVFSHYSFLAEGLAFIGALSGPSLGEYYPTEALLSLANFGGTGSGTIVDDELLTQSFDPALFAHVNDLVFEFEEEIFPGFFGRVGIYGIVDRVTVIDIPAPQVTLLLFLPLAFLVAARTRAPGRQPNASPSGRRQPPA